MHSHFDDFSQYGIFRIIYVKQPTSSERERGHLVGDFLCNVDDIALAFNIVDAPPNFPV